MSDIYQKSANLSVYQRSQKLRLLQGGNGEETSDPECPEMLLLLAFIDRMKRDYLECPQDLWGGKPTAKLALAREARAWATSDSNEEFSYRWLRLFFPMLPEHGMQFLTDGRVPTTWRIAQPSQARKRV